MDKSKKIIIVILVAFALCFVGLKACAKLAEELAGELMPELKNGLSYEHSNMYAVADTGSIINPISELVVNWVNGEIRIQYADTNVVCWQEQFVRGDRNEENMLHYWYEDRTLHIQYSAPQHIKSSLKKTVLEKNLVITLPRNLCLEEMEVSLVNGELISKVDARDISTSMVNGRTSLTLMSASDVEMSSVNGEMRLFLPENTSFEVEFSKVNGSFNSDFEYTKLGNTYTSGHRPYNVEVEVSTVNGVVYIEKQ